MARGIGKGDKVRIHMNTDSHTWQITTEEIWTVVYLPADVGDTWILERDGQVIEVNPGSHSFDGIELVERKEATE